MIGNGSYGRVVMGLDLQTGSIMAVKQVQLGNMDSAVQQEVILFWVRSSLSTLPIENKSIRSGN